MSSGLGRSVLLAFGSLPWPQIYCSVAADRQQGDDGACSAAYCLQQWSEAGNNDTPGRHLVFNDNDEDDDSEDGEDET